MTPQYPAQSQTGANPSTSDVTVRLTGDASPAARAAVRAALEGLPSVRAVDPVDGDEAMLSLRVDSLLLLLAEVGAAPEFAQDAVTWNEESGLVIDLPSPPPVTPAVNGVHPPDASALVEGPSTESEPGSNAEQQTETQAASAEAPLIATEAALAEAPPSEADAPLDETPPLGDAAGLIVADAPAAEEQPADDLEWLEEDDDLHGMPEPAATTATPLAAEAAPPVEQSTPVAQSAPASESAAVEEPNPDLATPPAASVTEAPSVAAEPLMPAEQEPVAVATPGAALSAAPVSVAEPAPAAEAAEDDGGRGDGAGAQEANAATPSDSAARQDHAAAGARLRSGSRWLWFGASVVAVLAVIAAIIALAQSSEATPEQPATTVVAVEPSPEATAEPSPPAESAATTAPPTATAVAAPPVSQRWARARDGSCLAPDGSACDPVYLALWQGQLGAWQAKAVFERQPLPDAQGAINGALALRAATGDLATRLDLAAGRSQAVVAIEAATLTSSGDGATLEVTVANLGNAAIVLAGAQIVDQTGAVWWTLPANAQLGAGERCTLSAAVTGPVCNGAGPATAGRSTTPPSILLVRAANGNEYDRWVLPK